MKLINKKLLEDSTKSVKQEAQINTISNNPIISLNTNNNTEEKVNPEKISQLEKKLISLEANNKQLKQIIRIVYDKYEVRL